MGKTFRIICFVLVSPLFIFAVEQPSPPTYGVHLVSAWIPMKDGVRLAATLYMPDDGKEDEKFPALLEYLPYRKDDGTAAGDYPKHTYFARRGYVSVRVDIRGFGASEGVPPEREYSEQEQEDGKQVIAWLAHQPWSNGNVGMFGLSWGGFTALQMAMRHAPGLKAILAVHATSELFHDDVHYIDGMAHVDEFELNMDMAQGWVGAPEYSLDEKTLGPRFNSPPWSLIYLKHQHEGPFWRDRVRPLSEITTPTFLIGGLQDGYRDNVTDLLMKSKAPIKAIVGPWNHSFPNDADFGPRVEWRDQAVRWFDYWLKGRDTGVMGDPRLVIYMQHWHPPDPNLETVSGEWRREDVWPPVDAKKTTFYLQSNHSLSDSAGTTDAHRLKYVPTVGVEAGFWWGELLSDPRPVDAFSLVYDSAPLETDVAILGRPQALLRASASAKLADWFARLSDVAPEGTVTQITGAGINGAQRESMSEPRDLEPDKIYPLSIEMHLTSWVFPKGHRIRVAISNALWPMILPTPYAMTTSLELGGESGSRLVLPIVPVHGAAAPAFSPPEPLEERTDIKSEGFPWPGEWTVERDEARQKTTVHWKGKDGAEYPWGTEKDFESLTYEGDDAHPETCAVHGEAESVFALKGRTLVWRGHLLITTDEKNFYYSYTRELLKDGQMIKSKTWKETLARDHQ
ncbi:MAG TPA: CocE/NonD family hydrolase [Candidatus Sulfotelmatobacter sp.]|nr:CocE/NonD family hydrolase [Candidatus Sulfotelmatobacter sp.]